MPAPRGQYTPRTGPLAGRSFASYYRYQGARAALLGYPSYGAERTAKREPMFQALYQSAIAAGVPRMRALSEVAQFMRQHPTRGGLRKHDAIKMAIDKGWVNAYDQDDDDWAPY